MGYQEEEVSGRCAAILANGKRCPNASLPGSRYCGLPAHQELAEKGTDYLVPPEDGGGEEAPGDEEPLEAGEPLEAEEPLAAEEPVAEEAAAESAIAEELADDELAAEALPAEATDDEAGAEEVAIEADVEIGEAPAEATEEAEES
jgi:transcription termination/antitermination protein NusA